MLVKPFTDNFNYHKSDTFVADETYIKVKGIKGYLRLIMDAVSRSIIGYRVSDNRGVGAFILAMRMAFKNIVKLPKTFKFIAGEYPAYPLTAQQFALCLKVAILCRANGSCLFISVRKLLHIIFYLSKQTGSKLQIGIDPVFKMERKLYAAFNIFSINIP